MVFTETKLKNAYLVELEKREDERGFFARAFCRKEFSAFDLNTSVVQCNVSFSRSKGTLRGMHYQIAPFKETKLVRCIKGSIYDVVIDLRPASPTFKQWFGVELTADNRRMLYVPEDFAHGFLTLEDNCEVFYQVSSFYSPESERGVRYNDPAFGIQWPQAVLEISEKDQNWPSFVSQ